ncbi:HalOD1 output domain-containing protein [Natrinema marinum]|uniref:HalOD1 output domain-containing protein n=1 Tax=Natrinema marinum TaxID=2961598 RepID=UPI0020C881D5|nr:HalOD1 output domain-containing protein [Natrinema marinum]
MVEGGGSVSSSSGQTPSQAVIEAVAKAEGIEPAALSPPEYEPLHAVVDPAALDALFADRSNGAKRPHGTVSFPFCGYAVTVDRDGTVALEEPTESVD